MKWSRISAKRTNFPANQIFKPTIPAAKPTSWTCNMPVPPQELMLADSLQCPLQVLLSHSTGFWRNLYSLLYEQNLSYELYWQSQSKGPKLGNAQQSGCVCIFGQGIVRNTKYMYFSNTPFMPFNFPCVCFILQRYMHKGHCCIWFSYLRYQHLLYTYLVYTKPVNIHFHTLWLATQVGDIHLIFTQWTCVQIITFPAEFWPDYYYYFFCHWLFTGLVYCIYTRTIIHLSVGA